ncbi:MAG: TMEM175 family protein [Mycobacteriales bacterium]
MNCHDPSVRGSRTFEVPGRRRRGVSDGVLAIAITLLILDVRVEQPPGESLGTALRHAPPQIGAYAASLPSDRSHLGEPPRAIPARTAGRPAAAQPVASRLRGVPAPAHSAGCRAHRGRLRQHSGPPLRRHSHGQRGRLQPDLAARRTWRASWKGSTPPSSATSTSVTCWAWWPTPSPPLRRSRPDSNPR